MGERDGERNCPRQRGIVRHIPHSSAPAAASPRAAGLCKITQPAVATCRRESAHCVRARACHGYLSSFRSLFFVVLVAWLLAQSSPVHCADEWLYTVQPGDNLWVLTERYLNDHAHLPELQRLNRIADPRRIPPGTQLRMPWAWTRWSPGNARFAAVVGTVLVSSTGQQGGERPATLDLVLHAGDMVKTEPHANAVLTFADGTHLTLLSDSILRLDKLLDYSNGTSAAWLDLQQGRIESQVPVGGNARSRFHINTPAGVTSVRGTQLRVSVPVQEAVSHTEVLVGAVYVANAGKEITRQRRLRHIGSRRRAAGRSGSAAAAPGPHRIAGHDIPTAARAGIRAGAWRRRLPRASCDERGVRPHRIRGAEQWTEGHVAGAAQRALHAARSRHRRLGLRGSPCRTPGRVGCPSRSARGCPACRWRDRRHRGPHVSLGRIR